MRLFKILSTVILAGAIAAGAQSGNSTPELILSNGSATFKESDKWESVNITLTEESEKEVSFDYCFNFYSSSGVHGVYAGYDDLGTADASHAFPICNEGESAHATIPAGSTKATGIYIKPLIDGLVENNEALWLQISDLKGAAISSDYEENLGYKIFIVSNDELPTVSSALVINVNEDNSHAFTNVEFNFKHTSRTFASVIVTGLPTAGSLTLNSKAVTRDQMIAVTDLGKLVYQPRADEFGNKYATFKYKVVGSGTGNNTSIEYTATINVLPVNDKPSVVTNDNNEVVFTVMESGELSGGKAEVKDKSNERNIDTYTFSLVNVTGSDYTVFNQKFELVQDNSQNMTVKLKSGATLDYTAKKEYVVYATVKDDAKTEKNANVTNAGPLTSERFKIVVKIKNVNDAPTISNQTFTMYEKQPDGSDWSSGTSVGMITASDPDGDPLTFSISTSGVPFKFKNGTNELVVSDGSALDYETKSTWTFKATVSDGDLTASANITVNLMDVNEPPSLASIVNEFSINENAATGTILGTFTVSDYDKTSSSFEALTYSLSGALTGAAGASSALKSKTLADIFYLSETKNTNGTRTVAIVVKNSNLLDYESLYKSSAKNATYPATITIKDASGNSLVLSTKISVIDVNEPLTATGGTFYLQEHAPGATSVCSQEHTNGECIGGYGQILAADPDIYNISFSKLTYKISTNNTGDYANDAKNFVVDNQGYIKTADEAEFEYDGDGAQHTYTFLVTVSDATFSKDVEVTVNIENIEEPNLSSSESSSSKSSSSKASSSSSSKTSSSNSEEPAIENELVNLDPFVFHKNNDAAENQRLWNELMKYKLYGKDSIVFHRDSVFIREPSGYIGGSESSLYLRKGNHTLGSPIITGGDISFDYGSESSVDKDSILNGPVHARWLVLNNWYSASSAYYGGTYCFENQIYFDTPDRTSNLEDAAEIANRFIANVHKAGGKIYADWDQELNYIPGLPDLNLDGAYKDCPQDIPTPEKNLSVPYIDKTKISWESAVNMESCTSGEVQYIHIPPITSKDLSEGNTWYDKYVEEISFECGTKKTLYILMPSSAQNANRKHGRLTRIFSENGINIQSEAYGAKIQVAYVNSDARWNETTNSWDDLNIETMTIVSNSNYEGNLLFYTSEPIEFPTSQKSTQASFQGTYITSYNISIGNYINIAGQLIAGDHIRFSSKFEGDFNYVPFNPPEIKTDIFVKDVFKERDNYWYSMNFYLTDIPNTEVSFDYCFEFFGDRGDDAQTKYARYLSATGTFASREDLAENPTDEDDPHYMPFCKDGQTKHIVIKNGSRSPDIPSYISVAGDGTIEGYEYMIFKITNLNGAVIYGNKFDGGLLVQLQDSDNMPPHFIDPFDVKLAVPENATKAIAGTIKAEDNEGDAFTYEIVGGTAAKLFDINATGAVTMKNGVEPFDYEAWMDIIEKKKAEKKDTSLTIEVAVCNIGGSSILCDDHEFTIDITDENEKPYFDYAENEKKVIKIAENATIKDGVAVKWADLDIYDAKGKFTNDAVIAIDGDTDVFSVTKSGVIVPKKTLDYETKNTYTLTLRVRDNTTDSEGELVYPDLYEDMEFSIEVVDANENPIISGDKVFSLYENKGANYIIGKLTSSDPDTAKAFTENVFAAIGGDTDLFTITEDGKIKALRDFDYEKEEKHTFELEISLSDKDTENYPNVTTTQTITINLKSMPEFPEITSTEFAVYENAVGGTLVGVLQALDPDGDTDLLFSLTEDNPYVTVSSTGEIKVLKGAKIDFEKMQKFTINVSVKDEDGLTSEKDVVINVIDVNESPIIKPQTFTVAEDADIGTLIGTLKATDTDTKNSKFSNLKFYAVKEDKAFDITQDGYLVINEELDYESDSTHVIKVAVTDGKLSDTTDITIKVGNVIEKSVVEITSAVVGGKTYPYPKNLVVNANKILVEWEEDGRIRSSLDTLKEGTVYIIKTYHNPTRDIPGADTVIVTYDPTASEIGEIDPSSSSSSSAKDSDKSSSSKKASSSSSSEDSEPDSSSSKGSGFKNKHFHVRMTGAFEFAIVMDEDLPSLAKQYVVMDMKGQVLSTGELSNKDTRVTVPTSGSYIVKVGLGYRRVNIQK